MQNSIYIRADGGREIGLGHLFRCIALADMLKSEFNIYFVCKAIPEEVEQQVLSRGFSLILISAEEDFYNKLSGGEIVVIDHYALGFAEHQRLKSKNCKVVCIDDLHDKCFDADLIINHAPNVQAADYETIGITQFALGLDYALLRPAFLSTSKARLPKRKGSVLICFGGSDPRNLTSIILEVLLSYNGIKLINIITGPSYSFLTELDQKIKDRNLIIHYHNINELEMVNLLESSELAIVPASGVLLEAFAVGNNIISGIYSDNQRIFFESYKKMHAFISAEDFSVENLTRAIDEALESKTIAPVLIDKKSNTRLLKLFKQLVLEDKVSLRLATKADLELTYKWATDKMIRFYSFSQSEIKLDTHSAWFNSKIEDNNCVYYIAELDGQAIGSIRFDIRDGEATISYLVDTSVHNRGLGIIVLKKGIVALLWNKMQKIETIIGIVMKSNIPSNKAFERLGFNRIDIEDNYKYTIKKS